MDILGQLLILSVPRIYDNVREAAKKVIFLVARPIRPISLVATFFLQMFFFGALKKSPFNA